MMGAALDLATAYALVQPAARWSAYRRVRPTCPAWITDDDLHQMLWEAVGELQALYQPHEGIPAGHYFTAGLYWHLSRVARRTRSAGRGHRGITVESQAQARIVGWLADHPDDSDLADSAAWAELLQALPLRQRRALWLHAVEGLSFSAIGRALGVPTATAWDLYRRAKLAARAFWQEAV